MNVDQYDWDLLSAFVEKYDVEGQISFDTYGIYETQVLLKRLIAQGKLMSNRYWIVSTNPPYMGCRKGMNPILKKYVEKNYPESKSDLYSCFIDRCINMIKENGLVSMITQQSFMFTDDYKELSDCTNSKYDIKENNGKITVSNNERLECKYDIKDLEIKENKIKKVSSIESVEANMNLILVLDVSGSMSSYNRLNNLKVVTKEMVNKIKLNNSTVSIITFNHNASTVLSLETDQNKINTVIDSLTSSGGTSFKVAISQTSLLLSKITNNKSNYVIFLSDGISADEPLYNNLSFVKMNSKVYTIGIGKAIASQLLNISSSSDNYYSYDDVNDESSLQSLFAIFDDIIQNITIEYGSGAENATDGVAKKGYLVLGKNAISKNNSVEVYYNDILLDKFVTVNKYIEFDGNNYLMNVYQYAIDHNIAYSDVGNLRFSYIFEEGAA